MTKLLKNSLHVVGEHLYLKVFIPIAEDTLAFYATPVDTTLPLDALKTVELPENLYIQHEYIRFHPETDTMFGGKSAFPKSSTIVTGLKYKDKYKGHVAKKSWP